MSISDYQPPVSELLAYGDCRNYQEWPNYVQELNLEEKHISELIKMATDEELDKAGSDSNEVWSPVHAWRALGQLQAKDALKPLLGLLANRDDDWISSDFPTLCTLIGLDSIPLLQEFLADSSHNFYARGDAAQSLEAISHKYPQTRESNVAVIAGELEKFINNDPTFNALLIGILVDLQAVEAIDIIKRAFQADRVDTFFAGDWEDIQVELGLKTRDEIPSRRFSEKQILASLFSSTRQTKSQKGFGSTQSHTKKKKSHKSSKKRKK
jgi:HEAT repeat protein